MHRTKNLSGWFKVAYVIPIPISKKLDNVHNYNTRKKIRAEFFQYSVASEWIKKSSSSHRFKRCERMYQKNFVIAHFQLLKNILKQISCLIISVVKLY